jgi:hypothetical protein
MHWPAYEKITSRHGSVNSQEPTGPVTSLPVNRSHYCNLEILLEFCVAAYVLAAWRRLYKQSKRA